MIAVDAPKEEREFVREFFELFKTPWELFHPGCNASVALVSAERAACFKGQAQLVIVYGSQPCAFDLQLGIATNPARNGTWIRYPGGRFPLYGGCLTFAGEGIGLCEESEQRSVAHVVCSGEKRWIRLGYSPFLETGFLLTEGQPTENAIVPTLDRHVELLRRLIVSSGIPVVEIPPSPDGFRFTACLTHDVDHPAIRLHHFDRTSLGFGYRAIVGSVVDLARGRASARHVALNWLSVLKVPLVHLGLARDFWNTFHRYRTLEHSLGATYYFIPHRRTPGFAPDGPAPVVRGAAYSLADVVAEMRALRLAGCELGVHGISAWDDAATGLKERELVSQAAGETVSGIRMHWLYFKRDSPRMLEAAGYDYDSTCGYNEVIGFRAGTVQAFKPPGAVELMELPLHVMDTALFFPAMMNLSDTAARRVVGDLVDAFCDGGVLTSNWHDRSIAPERLWEGFYIWFLQTLKDRGAWFPTAKRAVAWFRKRRRAAFGPVVWDGHTLCGCVRVAPADTMLPGLVLRVRKPSPCRATAAWSWATSETHTEFGFNENTSFSLRVP